MFWGFWTRLEKSANDRWRWSKKKAEGETGPSWMGNSNCSSRWSTKSNIL